MKIRNFQLSFLKNQKNKQTKKKRYKFAKSPGLLQLQLTACCLFFQQSLICFIFTSKQLSIYLLSKAPKQTELHLDDNTIKSTKVMVTAFQSAHNAGSPHPQLSQLYQQKAASLGRHFGTQQQQRKPMEKRCSSCCMSFQDASTDSLIPSCDGNFSKIQINWEPEYKTTAVGLLAIFGGLLTMLTFGSVQEDCDAALQ